jgi:AhpD family alkylhydroperoxidase
MSRLPAAEPHGLDLVRRLTFRSAKRMYGRPLEPTQIVAHHRPLLMGYGAIALAGERFSKSVDHRLKNLAMLRTAQLIGCEWCLDFGSYLARQSGCEEEQLHALSRWRDSDRFDALERLVLEYSEAMTRTPVDVSDELFGRLREHFDERQIVELTMAIALENLYSRSNWAFGIESEGFSDGSYCVAPDRGHAQENVSGPDRSRLTGAGLVEGATAR